MQKKTKKKTNTRLAKQNIITRSNDILPDSIPLGGLLDLFGHQLI